MRPRTGVADDHHHASPRRHACPRERRAHARDPRIRHGPRFRADAARRQPHHDGDQAQWPSRTGRPQQDRPRRDACVRRPVLRRSDARGHAHDFRPVRRRDHARTGRTVDPHRRAAHGRRARVRSPGRAPARGRDREGSGRHRDPCVLAIGPARTRTGADQRSPALVRAGARAQAQRRDRQRAQPALRLLRPAHALRPLPATPPDRAHGDRNAAAVLPAHRLRAERGRGRSARAVQAHGAAGLHPVLAHAVQLRHHARAALQLLPARFAGRFARRHLQALHGRGEAVEVQRRHRPVVHAHPLARLADPFHERFVERHRAVAEDAGRVRRRGEPGRQAQGRGVRVPGALACGRRGVPRTARQHRRRGAPHAQPQSRELDPRRIHAPRRSRRRMVAVRSGEGAAADRPVGRGVRCAPTARRKSPDWRPSR
ncbi:hypothetical protein ABIE51_003395 [Lysobacter sp. OAE881]